MIKFFSFRLLNVLDQVEARVEKLRKDAARIEEEKDNLLATLDAIRDSEWMLELDECSIEFFSYISCMLIFGIIENFFSRF